MKWFKQRSQREADLTRMSDEELEALNQELMTKKDEIRSRQLEVNKEVTRRYHEKEIPEDIQRVKL